jgi:hypothetical protein
MHCSLPYALRMTLLLLIAVLALTNADALRPDDDRFPTSSIGEPMDATTDDTLSSIPTQRRAITNAHGESGHTAYLPLVLISSAARNMNWQGQRIAATRAHSSVRT